jgi:hypothetical protein
VGFYKPLSSAPNKPARWDRSSTNESLDILEDVRIGIFRILSNVLAMVDKRSLEVNLNLRKMELYGKKKAARDGIPFNCIK